MKNKANNIKSIRLFVFLGGILPSLTLLVLILLEPHLLTIVGVSLAGYLFLIVLLISLIQNNNFTRKYFNLLNNIAVSICSIIIIIVIIELTFYFKYRDISIGAADTPSGVTFYSKYYKENQFGFRDREFNLEPPLNTTRILVLGDSFTYGMGIKKGNNTFPKVLERLLNANSDNKHFEVINGGKKGYNTAQELYLLKTIGTSLNPDLVILGYYINDTSPDNFKIPVLGNDPAFLKMLDKKLCQQFFSWYIFRTKVLPNFKKLTRQYNTVITSKESFEKHEIIFNKMVNFLKKRDIPLVVLIIPPSCYKKMRNNFTEKSLTHIRRLCEKYRVVNIDLAPVMEEINSKYMCRDLVAGRYDSHPSELVHEAYAQKIFDYFGAQGLLNRM